ncbi:MAG: hypothetical protein CMH83_11830 [Nocardioides sp.]|nr:hypothetical protein [Nocardioides sp.]
MWSDSDLERFDEARELEVSVVHRNGRAGSWTPIWVVRVGDRVLVRSWHRRTTGWFGHAVARGRARVRVPGVEADVAVADLGSADPGLRVATDTAYRDKYGPHGHGSMVTDEDAGTTLELVRIAAV